MYNVSADERETHISMNYIMRTNGVAVVYTDDPTVARRLVKAHPKECHIFGAGIKCNLPLAKAMRTMLYR
jgi:hypothetical protein